MPFYEYQCTHCDHRLEVLQKISEQPLVCCPECNQSTLKKLISAVAFRLKGTGWYETDFKNGGNKKEDNKENNPENNKDNKKEEGKTSDKSSSDSKVDSNSGGTTTETTTKTASNRSESSKASNPQPATSKP